MAISLLVDSGVAGASIASPGPTVSLSSAAGQTIVVCGLVFSTSSSLAITGISDNGSNTYQFSTSVAQKPPYQQFHAPVSAGYSVVFVGWCLATVNATTTVTITDNTGLTDFWRLSVSSWSGVVAADSGASNQFASTSNPASTVNLFNSGDLVIGASNDDSASYTGTPSGGGGWTDFAGAGTKPNIGYIFPGAAGNYTAQWTLSTTDVVATAVQAFSPVAITPPAAPTVLYSMRSFP